MENNIYKNEKLSKYNWFNLGGPAKIFFKPNSEIDLKKFLEKYGSKEKNIYILGAGSNTLFRDSGFNGIIIKLGKAFNYIKSLKDNKIEVGAATLDKKVSEFAMENSISGLEFLSCIPGSVGGAISMNSGCYNNDISKIFFSLKAMNSKGKIRIFNKNDIKFKYRGSDFKKDLVILSVIFKGQSGDKNKIENNRINLINKKRLANLAKSKHAAVHLKIHKIKKLGN